MEGSANTVIRVGSRKSELALIQTNYVINCLQKVHPDIKFEIVTMTTLGDRILNVSLPKIGEKSLFTKDLEDALQSGSVDFVVHSLKDLPTTLPDGLGIGAVFEREDPRDALVMRDDLCDQSLESLPPLSCVGTSSLRRTAQLRALYPHLRVVDVRGNLNTRLRKLQEHSANAASSGERRGQEYAALILAQSGLVRMGWQEKISQVLPCSTMMYAVGQGALAVECRSNNDRVLRMLAAFNHPESYCRVLAERSFLKTLGGGCSAPVGVSTTLKPFDNQHRLTISGAVWSLDGTTKVHERLEVIFPQVRRTEVKHKLSPTEDSENKKAKTETLNPIEEYNRRISARRGKLNCEYTRSEEEIRRLAVSDSVQNPIEEYNQLLSKLQNKSCEDTRSEEEIRRLAVSDSVQNPIEEYNQLLSKLQNNSCEDTRSEEEIRRIAVSDSVQNPIEEYNQLLSKLQNNSCEDTRSEEEIRRIAVSDSVQNPIEEYNQLLSKLQNNSCEDTRSEEEIRRIAVSDSVQNPIEEYNQLLSKLENKSCEDTRSEEEIRRIAVSDSVQNPIEEYNQLLSKLENKSCEDTRSEEEIRRLPNESVPNASTNLEGNDSTRSTHVNESNGNGSKVEKAILYCGLTENVNVLQEVIEKCEGLGKELANNLIGKGALEVMKVSQDYIRSSVQKS